VKVIVLIVIFFDRRADTCRHLYCAKRRDSQTLHALFLPRPSLQTPRDRYAEVATGSRISGTPWRKTATHLRRIRRNPNSSLLRMALTEQLAKREDPTHNRNQINSLGLLGSQVIHLATVRHALIEIVLRYSPTSL
jgi:hypothetical protein